MYEETKQAAPMAYGVHFFKNWNDFSYYFHKTALITIQKEPKNVLELKQK